MVAFVISFILQSGYGQIGKRFPSEMRKITDPVTGTQLTFLTSKPGIDRKIYQTHPQWTADGRWLIFSSDRFGGEVMAVNEKTGVIVQVTEGGFSGMIDVARKSMKIYFKKNPPAKSGSTVTNDGSQQVIEVDLEKLFADSENNKLKSASFYQRVCGTIPAEYGAGGDMALDANEDVVYFRVRPEECAKHLPEGTKIEPDFGPKNLGAGPGGIGSMNLITGVSKFVVAVPFHVGHVQANPWIPGEIVFCWETSGKAPQRTWTVMSDGTGLRPLYPESIYELVTHESFITKDEVAFAIMGHRKPGSPEQGWGPCGTREKPTGLGIVNLRTREMTIAGQTPSGSGFWHVNGSADGRWATGDDFTRNIYLIDRHSHEMILLSAGHKETAPDHPHPSFNADGTKIEIQSSMLSPDSKSMNICIIPVPEEWLKRKY